MTDLPTGDEPPVITNPDEAAKAEEILKREHGVPRGHTDLSDAPPAHQETISPSPQCLDDQRVWFFPAFAYCMVGIDRSVFELFSHEIGKPVDIVTYRAEKPVALFDGGDIRSNPWFYTVQGLEPDLATQFCDYIETFLFNDAPRDLSWCLKLREIRIADPFVRGKREGVEVIVFLPECLTSQKRVGILREPGLLLAPLILGVEPAPVRNSIG
jgi:hypothetical protein